VGKVNKAGAVTKRNASKARTKKRAPSGARGVSQKLSKRAATLGRGARDSEAPDRPTYRVRELDPLSKCGNGTSVQRLFRVDERIDGVVRPHLVFFDRHGWYCDHGRDCPAVSQARKIAGVR
jgi:hypothetical protein